jgi:glycosyltransferase involved in cell wall biosynthesis
MRLSVIIPAYNEQSTLGKVIENVLAVGKRLVGCDIEIVVCNDGSTDRTESLTQSLQQTHPNIKLVSHGSNQGKGAAIRTALNHVTGSYTLIQDADLEYDVSVYLDLVDAIRNGAPVVYASRFLYRKWPKGMQPANFVANKLLTATANLLYGLKITDEATALKLLNTNLLQTLSLYSSGFEFCPEVTGKLGQLRVPIVEVPVDYLARDIKNGKKVRWIHGFTAIAELASHKFRFSNGWKTLFGFQRNRNTLGRA